MLEPCRLNITAASRLIKMIDQTHDPALRSWVASANHLRTDFPIQNLPFGSFRRAGSEEPFRAGVAIGDQVLDLDLALQLCPWDDDVAALLSPLVERGLTALMALGNEARRALRAALSAALTEESLQGPFLELCLVPQAQTEMALPCRIGNFTDFCTGIHHATGAGKLFRPASPLLANYKWLPIASHGRSTSIEVSGHDFRRPTGQFRSDGEVPVFGPCQRLDFELEVGVFVGTSTSQAMPVPISHAEDHLFGMVLLNNWCARDLQAWEQVPLGPFLSKSFATTISPWIVTMEALAPFRAPFLRAPEDPQPLPYLDSAANREGGAVRITLEAWWQSASMRAQRLQPHRLCTANFNEAYWTMAQMLTHHTSNGCRLELGDLLGSGTQSGSQPGQGGSLLELTLAGQRALDLPGGERRTFLQDGDSVMLRGICEAPAARRIGFGTCMATVLPSP
jgi:fumarylacetoacetase